MLSDLSLLFLRELDALRREVELYPTDAALWSEVPGLPNSGGTLTLHLVGNLRSFIGATLGQTGYVRDRDAEFSVRGMSRPELSALIAAARREVADTMRSLDVSALPTEFPVAVGGVSLPTELFLLHLLSHLGYHLGQIDYHRRASTGDAASAQTLPLRELAVTKP